MLRRVRLFRMSRTLLVPWQLPALGWLAAWWFASRAAIAIAGLLTVAAQAFITRQMRAHQSRHGRLDRQVGAATSVIRDGFHREGLGDYILPGLEDDRASLPGGAQVTELRPRVTPAHRQPRSRRRKS